MKKNNFNKTLLQSYILTNCKRRLFLELGRGDPELWFKPNRPVPSLPPERLTFQRKYLTDKGKEYEQQVYKILKKLDNSYFKEDIYGNVDRSILTKGSLEKFYNILLINHDKPVMLLEYQFDIPKSFFTQLFEPKSHDGRIPVEPSEQRPDIMLIYNNLIIADLISYEITSEGIIREIPANETKNRFGISIFDIKYVQHENVGKKHFLEIFYYLRTLAMFIEENNLNNKFYVSAKLNGIFPIHEENNLQKIQSISDIIQENYINIISWKEANRIFKHVMMVIKRLWLKSPCPINSIKTNIHQGCGYCQYIEDCKNTLGMKDGIDPKEWSLKLIPFTSQSIAQQLIQEYNFKTIGDVLDKIDTIKIKSIPKPIYSELPTLKLKAEALINNREIYPSSGKTHSYAIPRYSPIAINFDVEYDQNHDRIFAVGIYLNMFISSKLPYHAVFDNWWRIWKTALEEQKTSNEIKNELKNYLIRDIPIEIIDMFLNCLLKLKLRIYLRGEISQNGTNINYNYVNLNDDVSKQSEAKLCIGMIKRLNLILQMCNIIEDYVVIDSQISGLYFGPDTSLFYWSQAQLDNFQNMLQRNLDEIINDDKAREAYESILMFFTPSDTEVSHPYQHKKLFDIQGFAESFVGFPDIINYTWHGIAKILFDYKFNPLYWIPHFNFLDLANWLRFLSQTDIKKKNEIKEKIEKQIIYKLQTINKIRSRFQKEGNFAISKNARVISKSEYNSAMLPSQYHDISHVWYLFSMLNSALQQQDDEHYRTMFPDFSIGKLFSAKISNLKIHYIDEKHLYYSFDVIKLSSNMKLNEGNRVLLIPNDKRGLKIDKGVFKWLIFIEKITWDPNLNGNNIISKVTSKNVYEMSEEEGINPKSQDWYLYPLSFDIWSNKLHNSRGDGLLERENFGQSWLGARLAFLWKIRTNPKLEWPRDFSFTTPSIYLYAPDLLSIFDRKPFFNNLLTKIFPKPDSSQEEAIKNSLNHVVSAILGPPGTGKSQTIAAFIDEFVLQRQIEKKSVKVLVSSFSYAALRVVIDKIRKGINYDNKPSSSSQLQMVFIRSETQEPIHSEKALRDVDDLLKKNNTWILNNEKRSVTKSKLLEESLEDSFIIFANAHQLYNLKDRVSDDFAFDLICIDEASQLPTDYFMSCLQYIHKPKLHVSISPGMDISSNSEIIEESVISALHIDDPSLPEDLTKIVIVGDHNQLPPVRVKNPPKNLEIILDSLFSYYVRGHKISNKQLRINYRSHENIVKFTSLLGLYEKLTAFERNAKAILKGDITRIKEDWLKQILDPNKVVCSLIHNRKFEIGISEFEADLVSKIVKSFYDMVAPSSKIDEIKFWTEKIGVVAPHNAQGRTIIRRIFNIFNSKTKLTKPELMEYLKNTIYSVEKFQGSDRDLIISSIGLSDEDKIGAEDDFIFDLNRFNVLTSRAKNKIIFILSNKFLRYIPEDRTILENASKIYTFVEEFCDKEIEINLLNERNKEEKIRFRFK